jgi:spermidine synthase
MASIALNSVAEVASNLTQREKTGALLLALCMFCTGGTGLVIEYVVATTTTFILGSSIVVWSLVIGIMMGAMGAAGFVQERIGDKYLLEKFFAIEVVLAVAGGYAPIGLHWAFGSFTEHFNLVLYGWTVLIGILVGLEIPIVMRILEREGIVLRSNLKYVFGMDYVGAMFFMFVWVFWLLPNFPITEISFLITSLNFVVALAAVAYFGKQGALSAPRTIVVVAIAAIALNAYGYIQNRDWSITLEQRLYDDPIVHQETTAYQHLVITRAANTCEDGTEEIRLYINGSTQFGSCDEAIYHDNLVHPAMTLAGSNRSVLILGGGDGLALRDVLRYKPSTVTLVDLDPDMVRIARDNEHLARLNRGAFNNTRVLTPATMGVSQEAGIYEEVRVGNGVRNPENGTEETERVADVRRIHVDAGKFLETARSRYDVIIVDLPDPSSVELSKLYSSAFYRQVERKLNPGGLMVVQSTSPIHAREVFLEIGRTIESVGLEALAYHDNVPSFGEWGWWMACGGEGCEERLQSRIASLSRFGTTTTYLTPERFRANLVFGAVGGVPFEQSARSTRINSMTDPTLFMRYEGAWKSY